MTKREVITLDSRYTSIIETFFKKLYDDWAYDSTETILENNAWYSKQEGKWHSWNLFEEDECTRPIDVMEQEYGLTRLKKYTIGSRTAAEGYLIIWRVIDNEKFLVFKMSYL